MNLPEPWTNAYNPWFVCAAVLALRIMGTGLAWRWLLPARGGDRPRWMRVAVTAGLAVAIGAPLTLLVTLLLHEAGVGSGAADLAVSGVLMAVGLAWGWRRGADRLRGLLMEGLPGCLLVFLGIVAIMLLPRRGEWILGGWDPGVYVNEGICLARSGTAQPYPAGGYPLLEGHELIAFARGSNQYVECLPGIPLNPKSRAVQHYFFRLNPTLVSMLARVGGLRGAVRAPTVAGLLFLVVCGALLLDAARHPSHALFALLLIGVQPVWLCHLRFPTSEMLQLLLMACIGLLLPRRRDGLFGLLMLATCTFCALLNRLSFLPFSGLLTLVVAWLDRGREDRGRVRIERAVLVGAIVAGLLFDVYVTWVTLLRLGRLLPMLMGVWGFFSLLAVGVDEVAVWPGGRAWLARSYRVAAGVAVVGTGLALVVLWRFPILLAAAADNARALMPFLGWAAVAAAVAGGICLACCRRCVSSEARGFIVFLLLVTAMLVVMKFVVGIYPWATRRYLPYTVFALPVLGGLALSWLWTAGGAWQRAGRVTALLLLGGLVAGNAKRSWHAWHRTEYDGISAVLADAAAAVADDDVLVVDHPWWGTPLMFIYQRKVLNGQHLYERLVEFKRPAGLRALRRLHVAGHRVRFLTSTHEGLGIYGVPIEPVTLDWESDTIRLQELIHGGHVNDYVPREREFKFRLFTWRPAAESRDGAGT